MKTQQQYQLSPVATHMDLVLKGLYVYAKGGEQIVVLVRSVKEATNEVVVQECNDKNKPVKGSKLVLRLHELFEAEEFEVHNNCVTLQLELNKAQSKYNRLAKEDGVWRCTPNTLNNPERLKVSKALSKAKAAYDVAFALLSVAKGQLDGRFNTVETDNVLNLDKLNTLIELHSANSNIDDGVDVSRTIKLFDLVNMCKVVTVAEKAIKHSPDAEHTIALRQAMYHLRMSNTWRTDLVFSTIWHEVFGGQVIDRKKPGKQKAVEAKEVILKAEGYAGKRVSGLAKRWLAVELEVAADQQNTFEQNSLVVLDNRFIKVKHHAGSKDVVTIPLSLAAKKVEYTNQVLCIRVRKNGEDSCKATLIGDEGMSTLQKLIGLHTTKTELEGLKNHQEFNSVVRCKFTKEDKWAGAELLVEPFERLSTTSTPEGRAVTTLLTELGYGPCIKSDSYEAHGYVQQTSTYLTDLGAFGKGTETCEDIARMLARNTKQVMNDGEVQFTNMSTYVFGLVNPAETSLPNDVDAKALENFNTALSRAFVAGQAMPSKKAFAYMGTGRYVTGSEVDGSGQKTLVCDPYHVITKELQHLYFNIAGGNEEQFVLAGLNSTKSKQFKHSHGWVLETFMLEGKKVALWVKHTKETYKLTSSATALQFRTVDEKLTGMAAAENSYARAVDGFMSETTTKLLYTNDGKTLFENATRLLAEGRIALKGHKVSTNIQFNQGLEAQFGTDAATRILSALVRNNKASDFRDSLVKSTELMEGTVAESNIAVVQAQDIVRTIVVGCVSRGILPESVKGKVLHMDIVKEVFVMLSAEGKEWVRICFPNKTSVLFPITQKTLESFEETGRWEYVATQGTMAEFFEAFAFAVQKTVLDVNEETGEVGLGNIDKVLSNAVCVNTANSIAKARDRMAGKELNRINSFGTTSWLAVSGRLKHNQIHYSVLNVIGKQASSSFRESVVFLYFKSPILLEGSISSSEVVDVVGTKEEQEFAKQVAVLDANGEVDVEYHNLMQGKCSYISPEKAVKNLNDADGDMHSQIAVPMSSVVGTALARPWEFIDITNPAVAVGAKHHKAHWEGELAGMYLNTTKTLEWVDLATKSEEIVEAIFRAAHEKINVGTFTTSQTALLNNRGAFTGHFKSALQACSSNMNGTYKSFNNWINNLLNNPERLEEVAEEFWKFTVAVQGTCINLDAMDQVKSSDGRDVLKLADLLRLDSFENCSYLWSLRTGNKASPIKVLGHINKRVDSVVKTMFVEGLHNMSVGRLMWLFDDVAQSEMPIFQRFVIELIIRCAAHAGFVNQYYFDSSVVVSKTPPKSNGHREVLNLETLKTGVLSLGKEEIEIACVQRTIANVAKQYVGKKLV